MLSLASRISTDADRCVAISVIGEFGVGDHPLRSDEDAARVIAIEHEGERILAPATVALPNPGAWTAHRRQAEVLRLVARGATNKVICRELGLAERTVKAHITAVFRSLKVSTRTQAALEAVKLGLG